MPSSDLLAAGQGSGSSAPLPLDLFASGHPVLGPHCQGALMIDISGIARQSFCHCLLIRLTACAGMR